MKRSDRRKRLSDIADVAASLHAAPIEAPDFTSSILDRVDAERAFLAPSVRRKIHIGRWAIGASVALVVLGVALTVRMSPSIVNVANGSPTPISTVVKTVESGADAHLDGLRRTIRTVSRTEPSEVISTFTAFAAASKAVELESPAAPTGMLALRTPEFTGPVLPVSTAMATEPTRLAGASLPQIQARWQVRPQTSDLNASMIGERQNARAMLDKVSSVAPALFEHESDGLPVIR